MRTFPATKIRNLARPFLVVLLLLPMALTACGYRGPLYLPHETPVGQPVETNNSGDLPPEDAEDVEDADDEEDGVTPV